MTEDIDVLADRLAERFWLDVTRVATTLGVTGPDLAQLIVAALLLKAQTG